MNTAELIKNAAENNPVYSIFDNKEVLSLLEGLKVEKTIWKGGIRSERSLCLATQEPKQPEDLITAFNLDVQSFPEKFNEAIAGDGQEYRRIRTLHSSSLISLLCFYSVSKEKPLIISIEGHDVEFFESHFEKKNLIGCDEEGKPHESNIDVFLRGQDKATGKNVVLFLESKFSEYLSWGKHSNISNHVYRKIYEQLSKSGYLYKMGLKLAPMENVEQYSELASISGSTQHYAGGIKQMISHFLGVKNVADSTDYEDCDLYLGEILYRFLESVDPNNDKFNDYTQLYGILAEGLNSISDSKFKVVGQCFIYQDVFKVFDLDKAVRAFYSL